MLSESLKKLEAGEYLDLNEAEEVATALNVSLRGIGNGLQYIGTDKIEYILDDYRETLKEKVVDRIDDDISEEEVRDIIRNNI